MDDVIDQARFWDDRFGDEHYVFGTEPNAFLQREAGRLPKGARVLAVADGEGRNGVFLAKQGFSVLATDISEKGLAKGRRLARDRGATLRFEQVDLARYDWPERAFDAVIAIFVQFAAPSLRERMFKGIAQTLKPGGMLLLEGYRPEQLDYGTGGPPHAQNMYTEELLRSKFATWEIELLESHDREIQEGSGHGGMSALIDLIARKPR